MISEQTDVNCIASRVVVHVSPAGRRMWQELSRLLPDAKPLSCLKQLHILLQLNNGVAIATGF